MVFILTSFKRLLVVCVLVVFASTTYSQSFFKSDTIVRNIKWIGVDIDLFTFGKVPLLYVDVVEFDIKRSHSSSRRMLLYALETTAAAVDSVSNHTTTYISHNICPITYEKYLFTHKKFIIPPKIVSIYGKLSYAVFTQKNTFNDDLHSANVESRVSSELVYTPYLELGTKMYVGAGNAYWGTLSVGYTLGGKNLHKMARFNNLGLFVNYEFCIGFINHKGLFR